MEVFVLPLHTTRHPAPTDRLRQTRWQQAFAAILVAVMGLVGCKGADEATPTWHTDVRPIIDQSCVSCHDGDGGLTSIRLDSYEEASAWQAAISAAVESRTMPPWGAAEGCNEYKDDLSLSQEEIDTIVAWADAGAPEGDPAEAAPEGEPWSPAELSEVDLTLQMPVAYTTDGAPDDYRCFIVEWPYDETVWATGFEIVPDNTAVVHHVVPFIIDPDDVDTFRQMDADEEGEGYTCFGGPGGDPVTLINTRWLGSWTPGSGAVELPEGFGFHIDPGSIIVMQMHYNVSDPTVEPDQSWIDVRLETEEQKEADIFRWADFTWLFGVGMEIPANTDNVEHTFTYLHTDTDARYTVHSVMPHMHNMGQSIDVRINHEDGSSTCLLEEPRYDFNWQRTYWLEEPLSIGPGDEIEQHCVWNNPTDQDVYWGEGTVDEMCLMVVIVTMD